MQFLLIDYNYPSFNSNVSVILMEFHTFLDLNYVHKSTGQGKQCIRMSPCTAQMHRGSTVVSWMISPRLAPWVAFNRERKNTAPARVYGATSKVTPPQGHKKWRDYHPM